ncbi:alpha/beta hydrolase [Aciditerrimonas ferrireducens]|uniref:Alpha/beta hydrolase n=1 Tax=Aciditerrimonas ferrireducens TaxID=667306 RepID=A0ABV6C1T6_9ACTN
MSGTRRPWLPPPVSGQLVAVPAGSDPPLDGFFAPGRPPARGSALLQHGNGANFYSGPVRFLLPALQRAGFDCLSLNRHGHETLTTRTRDPEGNAYQTAAQAAADVDAARDYLATRGAPLPVVVGHSNGALFSAHHAARRPPAALVLLSPHCGGPELLPRASANGLLGQGRLAACLAEAEALVAQGRPEALVLLPGWWYVTSAGSLLDLARNLPRLLDQAPLITCPTLVLRGGEEDPELYPAEAFAATVPAPADAVVVPGTDHFYTGREQHVAALVVDWLDQVLPRRRRLQPSNASS